MGKSGQDVLRNPRLNKGTAFTQEERRALGLEGLLPPASSTLDLQVARVHAELANLDNDLQKYLLLSDLQARNETLYYAVLISDPARFMPIVYTPTVGEACQKFDHIFRAARGMYLPITAHGRVKEVLANWPADDVRFIVVTDGERILGLGDQGVGGMGIPIGKLALYTACAGVPPQVCLPVTLDVGTNNQALIDDPLYLGLRQPRARGEDYDAFIDEFVEAVQALHPRCCIQWEDFANINAVPILARWRDRICTFNDDIQGTASVALAGFVAALRLTGGKLVDQRLLFLGAGSAGTGIAELVSQAMAQEGLPIAEARARSALFDVDGLVVASRNDLAEFQRPFAQDRAPIATFVEAVRALKPTAIVGVCGMPHLFNAVGMHGRGGLSLVGRPGDLRQRQPLRAGGPRRSHLRAGPGQQRLCLPGRGPGGLRHRSQPGDGRDVHHRRARRGGAGQRREPAHGPDLSAPEPDPGGLAARRHAGRPAYLRRRTGPHATAGGRGRLRALTHLSPGLSGFKLGRSV